MPTILTFSPWRRPRKLGAKPIYQPAERASLLGLSYVYKARQRALMPAIAFGIGGREVARDILEKAYNRSDEVTSDSGVQQPGSADRAAQQNDRL